ncbi:MAG: hypothetical protein IKA36_01120 [Clostridia bacterium]|nr:hypothetical protein [Clostridia bacterium]
MAKTNSLNFKINNNTLFINDDRFDLNELLIGEIVRVEDYNENYSIKLTLKDDFVDKWAILVDYNTNDKTEILYNFKRLISALQNENPNYVLYNNKYFLNLENIEDISVQQKKLTKYVNIKSGNKNYKLNYSKDEYISLDEEFTNIRSQNKGI